MRRSTVLIADDHTIVAERLVTTPLKDHDTWLRFCRVATMAELT